MISSTQCAEREHRPQARPPLVDLVDGQVVVRQQGTQMVRDPPQRVFQRVGRKDPGGGIDKGIERSAALLRRHVAGRSQPCVIDPRAPQLDRRGRSVRGMWHEHRSPRVVVREWRMPGPERRAAHAERRAEAEMRRERDSEWTPERRAAALEAERRKYQYFPC